MLSYNLSFPMPSSFDRVNWLSHRFEGSAGAQYPLLVAKQPTAFRNPFLPVRIKILASVRSVSRPRPRFFSPIAKEMAMQQLKNMIRRWPRARRCIYAYVYIPVKRKKLSFNDTPCSFGLLVRSIYVHVFTGMRERVFLVCVPSKYVRLRICQNLHLSIPPTKRIHAVKYAFDWSLRVLDFNAQLLSSPRNVPESLRATFFLTAKK